MQAFVNERKVKISREIGRWLSLFGLGVLIVGMIISIRNPELIFVSLISLAIGFLTSTIGAYYANRWTRSPRADEALTKALKGIGNQYHLYHYLLPVSHVLLGPAGFFLFRVYLHEGPITYDGKRWKQKFNLLRSLGFSGQDALGDPVRDVEHDVQRFVSWLRKRMPEDKIPQITPFIVFVRDGAELDVVETEIPVVTCKQLKKQIRNIVKARTQVLGENALYDIERAILGDKIDEL